MVVLENIVSSVNSFLWDFFLLFALVGTGVWFTIRTKGIQIRYFTRGFKQVFGNIKLSGDKAGKDGMSSFQALATSIAAQVGTGNLAGAATAIASGGMGAIFWMWVSAFFGMATNFVEASLAQKYKTVGDDGAVTGGPVYYIRAAYKGAFGKVLAALFSVFIVLALGFIGNMVQSNSIGDAFHTAFGINPLIIGVIVAALAFFIFLGGVGSIASVTEKIVPIMAAFYLIGGLVCIFVNIGNLPSAIASIFVNAFAPKALFGGAVGTSVQLAIRYGVARGLFSNEAGMGSTPHSHALAKVNHPCEQGCTALMGVFIDTFIVLTMTALVIGTSGILEGSEQMSGITLTQAAFDSGLGALGAPFIAICMFFFAFSTIVGWYFFGEQNIRYLFGSKAVKPYAIIVCACIICGCALKVDLVWAMADMFNGLMVIPNLLGLLPLTKVFLELMSDFEKQPAKAK
ncbi:MAG: sodium:alanine symporter family protein [Oscillospiraceae bacterium]|nr:sodium:alanine symporter family protein [Oscillospiraceae bacterium]